MTDPIPGAAREALVPVRGGLLPPGLRRDIADLNTQYFDLGLRAELEGDPRFAWSESVRHCLLEADADTLARVAAAPFALFDLLLPAGYAVTATVRVEDSLPTPAPGQWLGRCASFAHQATSVARRLADCDPLTSRVALGLSPEAHGWLVECRPSQLAELAGNPQAIRPRWRLHARFWETLVGAARRNSSLALQWAYCMGLSLIDATDGATALAAPRRRTRR
jgi:hypothetical protein